MCPVKDLSLPRRESTASAEDLGFPGAFGAIFVLTHPGQRRLMATLPWSSFAKAIVRA